MAYRRVWWVWACYTPASGSLVDCRIEALAWDHRSASLVQCIWASVQHSGVRHEDRSDRRTLTCGTVGFAGAL